jgi:lipoprotein-anchoring transpeptidase ErfK/SrfK
MTGYDMRIVSAAVLLASAVTITGSVGEPNSLAAQGFVWRDDGFVEGPPSRRTTRPAWDDRDYYPPGQPRIWGPQGDRRSAPTWQQPPLAGSPQLDNEIRDGGSRPAIAPATPPIATFDAAAYQPGTIVIVTDQRRLYYVLPGKRAYVYQISVGREGFDWYGSETVSRKQEWPDWHPPAEMRQRDPSLPVKMTGGLKNPLGAVALYLGTTLYRIHGTNDEKSLGQAQSSGCFRMLNASVLHLASIAEVGTRVHVVKTLGPAAVVSGLELPAARSPLPPVTVQPPVRTRSQVPAWQRENDDDWDLQRLPRNGYRQRRYNEW